MSAGRFVMLRKIPQNQGKVIFARQEPRMMGRRKRKRKRNRNSEKNDRLART